MFKNGIAKCFSCAINEYKCSGQINTNKRGKKLLLPKRIFFYIAYTVDKIIKCFNVQNIYLQNYRENMSNNGPETIQTHAGGLLNNSCFNI